MRKIMALGLAPALLIGIVPAPTALASSQDSDEAVKTSAYGLTDDYVLFDFTEKEIRRKAFSGLPRPTEPDIRLSDLWKMKKTAVTMNLQIRTARMIRFLWALWEHGLSVQNTNTQN